MQAIFKVPLQGTPTSQPLEVVSLRSLSAVSSSRCETGGSGESWAVSSAALEIWAGLRSMLFFVESNQLLSLSFLTLCQFQVYSRVISFIHIHISIIFPYRLLQNIEQSFLCYAVGLCRLSVLHIAVCICQSQSPNLSFYPTSLLW